PAEAAGATPGSCVRDVGAGPAWFVASGAASVPAIRGQPDRGEGRGPARSSPHRAHLAVPGGSPNPCSTPFRAPTRLPCAWSGQHVRPMSSEKPLVLLNSLAWPHTLDSNGAASHPDVSDRQFRRPTSTTGHRNGRLVVDRIGRARRSWSPWRHPASPTRRP